MQRNETEVSSGKRWTVISSLQHQFRRTDHNKVLRCVVRHEALTRKVSTVVKSLRGSSVGGLGVSRRITIAAYAQISYFNVLFVLKHALHIHNYRY